MRPALLITLGAPYFQVLWDGLLLYGQTTAISKSRYRGSNEILNRLFQRLTIEKCFRDVRGAQCRAIPGEAGSDSNQTT